MRMLVLLIAVAAIVLISGCTKQVMISVQPSGSNEAPEVSPSKGQVLKPQIPQYREFRMSITHTGGYSPNTFTVDKGDTVIFLATSDPVSHNHGITIDAYNINITVTAGPNDNPQKIEFTANKTGTFEIYCKTCIDGPMGPHPWLKGILIVKE